MQQHNMLSSDWLTTTAYQHILENHQAAKDAQTPRHRDVDQPAGDPLCSFVLIKSRQKGSSN
jgi:hypothetical protein